MITLSVIAQTTGVARNFDLGRELKMEGEGGSKWKNFWR